jgi:ribosomal protein S18 acetylase RimI-like enzyme
VFRSARSLDALIQGRGIGRALMCAVRERYSKLWLVTTNDNLHAQRFYSRLGLRLVAVHAGAIAKRQAP